MRCFTVGNLKSSFSEILDLVRNGEEIVISYGKKKVKIAVIVPFEKYMRDQKRTLGLCESVSTYEICEDFKMSDEELLNS